MALIRLNLSRAIRHWANFGGNPIAFDCEEKYTYKQIDSAADYIAHKLAHRKKYKGRACLFVKHKPLLAASIAGCLRAGIPFVPINPEIPERYLRVLDDNGQISIIIREDCAKRINLSCRASIEISKSVLHSKVGAFKERAPNLLGEAGVIFTSGTTREPKGVVRNHYSLLTESVQWIIELGLHFGCRVMIGRPLYYTGGFVLASATLFVGGTIVTIDNDSAGELVYKRREEKEPLDVAFLVPFQINELIQDKIKNNRKLARILLTMGAPITGQAKVRFARKFRCKIIESWGNSEGLGTITKPSDLEKNPNTIGKPFFCDEIAIVNTQGRRCGPGQIGFLCGFSDNCFDYYLGESLRKGAEQKDRMINSGDLGYQDRYGNFYVLGRFDEAFRIRNRYLFPAQIEQVALESPAISDCAVMRAERRGQKARVILLAVLVGREDPKTLLNSINLRLNKHEKIYEIVFVDSIPRNQGGKVEREKLSLLLPKQ